MGYPHRMSLITQYAAAGLEHLKENKPASISIVVPNGNARLALAGDQDSKAIVNALNLSRPDPEGAGFVLERFLNGAKKAGYELTITPFKIKPRSTYIPQSTAQSYRLTQA